MASALALTSYHNQIGIAILRRAVLNNNPDIKVEALVGLLMLRDPDAFKTLKAIFRSDNNLVRERAAWAMARSNDLIVKTVVYRLH